MLTATLILLAIIIIGYLGKLAWRYHIAQLRAERDKRIANYNTAKILADQLELVVFGRDYYRAALIEITRVSSETEPAGEIARRFLALEDTPA